MAAKKALPYGNYLRKTFWWLMGNTVFGLAPLLFMCIVYLVAQQKAGNSEISHLIHEGVIPFVCVAIMGSVLVDFALSGFAMKGWGILAVYICPCCIMSILCIEYLLVTLKIIDDSCFNLDSLTTIIVIGLSFVYCIFTKTNLYIKEDTRHEPIV